MTYKEIVDFIANIKVYKTKLSIYLKNHYKNIYDEIIRITRFLDDTNEKNIKIKFNERLYCIRNNITERPKCIECDDYVYFRQDDAVYRDFCSVNCSKISKQTKERRESTNERIHGNKHFNNIDKARVTRYTKNNGKWLEDDHDEKTKATLMREHNDPHWNNPEKSGKTCMDKYKVKSPLMLKEIQDKCRESFKRNHPGMNSTMDIPEHRNRLTRGTKERSWKFVVNSELTEPLFTKEEYLNIEHPDKAEMKFRCKKCGHEYMSNWDNGVAKLCPKCHPGLKGTSESEMEIAKYISSVVKNGWTVHNKEHINKTILYPKEIDIVVCDGLGNVKLLVEYDGLFFHSDYDKFPKDKNYHLEKTIRCEEIGYRLIHIFENEWITKGEVVKSRLRKILSDVEVVEASLCEVEEITQSEFDEFMSVNDINGHCNSGINIGLKYKNNIVSVISISKTRFNKRYEYEIRRYCEDINVSINGSISRMIEFFEKKYNPKSILCYVDRRWKYMEDELVKAKFINTSVTKPNYWYFKPNDARILYNRLKFRKSEQGKLLKEYDNKASEVENMKNNGYLRIFDCGNLVYVKKYEQLEN